MKAYYIIDGSGKQSGPFPGENLRQHGITPQTYVWCEGMGDNWKKACEVAELAVLFAPQPQSNTTQPIGQNPPIQAGASGDGMLCWFSWGRPPYPLQNESDIFISL